MSPHLAEPMLQQRAGAPCATRTRLNVCLVSHFAYGALSRTPGHVGGVEHQTSMLARWLADRKHQVTMITWDEGQQDVTRIDGVKVVPLCRQDEGFPIVRFFHPRWSSLIWALREADADVYYQNCADYVTGQVALWCRHHGRKFVYSAASSADCDPKLPLLITRRDRVLYRMGLRRADRIVVQTREQQQALRRGFGHGSIVIPMPSADHSGMAPDFVPSHPPSRRIAWIGRLCEVKRPDRLIDIAGQCPDLPFDLVGPSDGSPYAVDVLERAARLPNVTVHGSVDRVRVAEILRQAAALCCTSEIEGFPNTFLEAWSHAVPVVSTFDPDGVIEREGLGWVGAPDRVPSLLGRALVDRAAWRQAAAKARGYYVTHHTVEAVMPQFEALLLDAVGDDGDPAA